MFTGFGVDDMSCDVRVALLFLRRDGFLPGGTYRRDQEYEKYSQYTCFHGKFFLMITDPYT